MSGNKIEDKLFAMARANPPSDHVPYAFEKRVMAALTSQPIPDAWALWSRALWQAAAMCVAIMVLTSVWTVTRESASGASANLAADLESTVWGPLSSINDSW